MPKKVVEQEEMITVSTRVPASMHIKVRHKLLDDGLGIRDVLRAGLQAYLDGRLAIRGGDSDGRAGQTLGTE